MKQFDIFGIESGCLDLNVCIDEMPELNRGTRVSDLSWQGGGPVSSGMVAAARLGAKCTLSGTVGSDSYGRMQYNDFVRHGINLSNFIIREGKTTSLDVVLAEKKSMTRTFLFKVGNVEMMTEDEVDWDLLLQSKLLFISGWRGMALQAAKVARENGIEVLIDAGGFFDGIYDVIPLIDYFIASEFCFDGMFPGAKEKGLQNLEEECRKVREMGPKAVLFTFGERGLIGLDDDGFFTLPAFKVDVVDTVGAGDIFHGAFAAMVTKGKSVRDCAMYASATSAIKCTRIGGRAGIPTMDVLEKFLATGEIDYSEIDKRVEFYRKGNENLV